MSRFPSIAELLASSAARDRQMMALATSTSTPFSVPAPPAARVPVLQPPPPATSAVLTTSLPACVSDPYLTSSLPHIQVPTDVQAPELNPMLQVSEQFPPFVTSRPSSDVNKTPPKMEGSFNLYRAQVRAFLHRFGAWGLVDGTVVRPVPAGPEQQKFDMLDFFVKDTLLRGVKVEDAERMCDLSSGKEMWEDLEAHHTKREFSNYVWVMKKFFHATYSREQKMDSWLQEIHDTRRALSNLGRVIDDDLTVDVILMGVVHTHRAVVRQFSRIMTPGSRPTLQQVLNTLKSETEMDEIVRDEEEESGKIMHVAKKQKTDDKSGKENVGFKFENRGGKTCSKAGGNKRKKGVCHYCGKAGHYKIVCRKRQFDLKHGTVDRDANPGGGGGTKNGSKGGSFQPSPIGMIGRVENTCAVTSTGSTFASSSNLSDSLEWILDSAAITHTCADRLLMLQFPHYTETNTPHESWTGEVTTDHLVSNLEVSFVSTEDRFGHNGGEFPCKLNGVRNVPGCHVNLLSVNVLEEEGWKCETRYPTIGPPQRLVWKDDRAIVFEKSRGYYRSRSINTPVRVVASATRSTDSLFLWHLRFGHVNAAALQNACRDQRVTGMQIAPHEQSGNVIDCLSCTLAKSRRMSYKRLQPRRSLLCCEKLMTDVCHYGEKSVGGNVKFQLVEDEFSRYVWGFLLRHKSQSAGNLKTLILQLRQRGRHVRFIGSDQGTEFKNQELKVFMKENGIRPVRTNTYTPEENCLVEKMNGIMLRAVRTLLITTGLATSLWGEAFKFAVTVYNFSPSKSIQGRSPYELYEGRKPNVSGLRVWGCAATYFVPKQKRKGKHDQTAREALFLGYPESTIGYRVLDLVSGRIVESRDVKFREQWTIASDYIVQLFEKVFAHQSGVVLPATVPYVKLPLHDYTNSDSGDVVTSTSRISDYLGSVDDQQVGDDVVGEKRVRHKRMGELEVGNPISRLKRRRRTGELALTDDAENSGISPIASEDTTENGDQQRDADDDQQRQETRKERKPSLVEVRHHCRSKKTPSEPLRRSTRIRRANTRLHGYSLANYFISTMDKLPKSVRAALASPNREKWLEAMEAEFQSIQSNETWMLVKRPQNTKVMTSRWVFVIKRNQHGEIERYKARLTIRGFEQVFGSDYWEIYSPVVSMEAIRVVIVLAFYYDLDLRQIDFTTAFLNGDMDVDVYMEQPELFDDGSGRVCLLKKSLYGLKQAPLIWNETLKKYLLKLGFKASIIGDGVYVKWIGDSPVFLTVYVDDVVIAAKTKHIEWLIGELKTEFKLKDLGEINLLLAMDVKMETDRVTLSQETYIRHLVEKFGTNNARIVRTPMDVKARPAKPEEPYGPEVNRADLPYRQILGSLQYLVRCTRPDIANAVCVLSKFMNCYTVDHYALAQRVLMYLKGTASYGLVLSKQLARDDLSIVGYADADLGNDPDTRRSISGQVVKLGGCVVAYQSKHQGSTITDTCSAELTAASSCADRIRWLQNLLVELQVPVQFPALLWTDSMSAVQVMTHSSGHHKIKCLDLAVYKVVDYVNDGYIQIKYLPSMEMPADTLTKALGKNKFRKHRKQLGVKCLCADEADEEDQSR